MGVVSCTPCVRGGPLGTGTGPPGTTGGAPRGTAGSGAEAACGGGPAPVGLATGTARGGSAACAPGARTGAILPAAPWGTQCASPCDNPSCWTPGPGAGTSGGADVADDADYAATVGPPTNAAGGTGTAC